MVKFYEFFEKIVRNYLLLSIIPLLLIVPVTAIAQTDSGKETDSGYVTIFFDEITDTVLNEGQTIRLQLKEFDLNRDPNKIEVVSIDTAYEKFPITFIRDNTSLTNFQFGGVPTLDYQAPYRFTGNNNEKIQDIVALEGFDYDSVYVTENEVTIDSDGEWNFGWGYPFWNYQYDRYGYKITEPTHMQYYIFYDISSLNSKSITGTIDEFVIEVTDGSKSLIIFQSTELKGFVKIPQEKIEELRENFSTGVDVILKFSKLSEKITIPQNSILPLYLVPLKMGYSEMEGLRCDYQPFSFEYFVIPEFLETGPDTGIFETEIDYFYLPPRKWAEFDFSTLNQHGSNIKIPVVGLADIHINYMDPQDYSNESVGSGGTGVIGQDFGFSGPLVIQTNEDEKVLKNMEEEGMFCFYVSDTTYGNLAGYYGLKNNIEYEPRKDLYGNFTFETIFHEFHPAGNPGVWKDRTISKPITTQLKIIPMDDPIFSWRDGKQYPMIIEDIVKELKLESICESCPIGGDGFISVIDPDNDELTFSVVTAPTHLELSGSTSITVTPEKDFFGEDEALIEISDGINEPVEIILQFTVTPTPDIPVAKAGTDQSVNTNVVVQLDGTASNDADGDSLTYSWIQTAGYPVTLSDKTIINPQFIAPSEIGQLTFMLTVSDGIATSNPDVVNVYVGEPVPEPTSPPTPTLSSSTTSTSTNLSWKLEDDGGSPITNYVVEYKESDSSQWAIYKQLDDSTSLPLTNLEYDQSYDFRIYAENLVGKSSVSDIISVTLKEKKVAVEPEPTVEPGTIQYKVSQIKEKVSEIKRLLEILRNR